MVDNRRYYDEFSKSYDTNRHEGYHALIDSLEIEAVTSFARNKSILEAGCGSGLLLKRLADISTDVTGIDLSKGMLDRAKERHSRIAQSDLLHLPFRSSHFDLIVSFKVLAHVEPIDQVMNELIRITKPGGFLCLEFYNPHSLRGVIKKLKAPSKTSQQFRDEDIITRYDSLKTLKKRLHHDLEWIGIRGVRVFTPAAFVHRIPVVKHMFTFLEKKALRSVFSRFGGFVIVILKYNPADPVTS
jgi:ubiquinone/menaquinone biosynthesis C-methylase UbiE